MQLTLQFLKKLHLTWMFFRSWRIFLEKLLRKNWYHIGLFKNVWKFVFWGCLGHLMPVTGRKLLWNFPSSTKNEQFRQVFGGENCSFLVEDGRFQSDLRPVRDVLCKKRPPKSNFQQFLNNPMWSQLFLGSFSKKNRQLLKKLYGRCSFFRNWRVSCT